MPYCFLPALHLGGWSGEQVQAGCQASSAPLPGHAQPHVTALSLLVLLGVSMTDLPNYFPYNTILKPTFVLCYI